MLPSGKVAKVRPAGVRADGSLAVPDDPAQLGWWTGGAQPGERYGNVVIAGHVDAARFGLGVMAELLDARRGQLLVVRGDGASLRYRITSVRRVVKARLTARSAIFAQDRPQRLVLITCGGSFDTRTHRYADNVVIEAEPT
jgi:sortase (surface protein transpeptidase)